MSEKMEGILIFDHTNDLIYQNLNEDLKCKMVKQGKKMGILDESETFESSQDVHPNVLIQIYTPLITSQRIMLCQFDNSYTSIQMDNDLNIVFEEFLGYLFLHINTKEVDLMKRELGVFICFMKHFSGPIIYTIKNDTRKKELIKVTHKIWIKLYAENQNILVEANEQLLVNADVKGTVIKILQDATDKLKQDPHSQRSHSIIFVKDKFLSLYSSRQAHNLSSVDLLFLNILCQTLKNQSSMKKIESFLLFLDGMSNNNQPGCVPHLVHISKLFDDIFLVHAIEYGNISVSNGLFDVFTAMHKLQNIQMQYDIDNLRAGFEDLEPCVKHTIDAVKKTKYNNAEIDDGLKIFVSKWDILKKKYQEYFKSDDRDLIIKIESNMPIFMDAVKELFKVLYAECSTIAHGIQRVTDILKMVNDKLNDISDFLQVKAIKNFSMGSYLEEFPGLVHFLHIDRTNGRLVAPGFDTEEGENVVKGKVWSMVELSRRFLHTGHMSMIWKDVAFSYTYFLWFEDANGTSLKADEVPDFSEGTSVAQLIPGILAGDYYQKIIEICFPKTPANRIKCYEIFCVHLGLVTASCVLEHCRRLAATISDVTGCFGNPIDLL